MSHFSALILAGGLSRRMGFPKPWLVYDTGTTYLERIVHLYHQAGIRKIRVVLNHDFCTAPWLKKLDRLGKVATIVQNEHPERDRLFSVFLGMQEIDTGKILIHNVDNPFIETNILTMLISQSGDEDVTIPTHLGRSGHPVIINARVREEIIHAYKEYHTLKELLTRFNKKYVEVPSDSIFQNINTLEAYQNVNGPL